MGQSEPGAMESTACGLLKKFYKPVVIPGPTGCPYSNISSDIQLFNFVHINPTQSAEFSNYYTCTQLIQEERWK